MNRRVGTWYPQVRIERLLFADSRAGKVRKILRFMASVLKLSRMSEWCHSGNANC